MIDGPSDGMAVDRLDIVCMVEADPARRLPIEDMGNGVIRFEVAG